MSVRHSAGALGAAVLGLAVMLAWAGPSQAGVTATLVLRGSQPAVLEISVTPHGEATNLDLTTNASAPIGSYTARSNSSGGYVVTVESVNLRNGLCADTSQPCFVSQASGSADQLPYRLSSGGGLLSGYADGVATLRDTTNAALRSERMTPADGFSQNLTVSYQADGLLLSSDYYSDTLTFSISTR